MKEIWCINPARYSVLYDDGLWYDMEVLEFNHRMPDWMPLGLHLAFEKLIMRLFPSWIFDGTIIEYFYHFTYGLICGFSMRDILGFLRRFRDDHV